jgi:hypothetical protein
MRNLRPAILAVLLGTCAFAPLPTPSFAQTCTCAGSGIHADVAPPPLPDYDQPPIPSPGYMWTPGYWAWNNYDYYWVPGTWVDPPQEGLLWTPGYWGFSDGAYVFNAGYWGPHVGFYGGISYGFGYTGDGYEGGRWDNGQFFYNRSVTNVGNVRIANVYNKTITVNNVTINRVSFNGGASGIAAKPTPEQETLAKEQHVGATKLQLDHARSASMKPELFDSTNHGKPKVAATARAAEFKGPGLVPAKAAGAVTPVKLEPGANPEPKTEETRPGEKPESKTPAAEKSDIEKKTPEAAPSPRAEPAVNGASKAVEKPLGEKPREKPTLREKNNPEKKTPEAAPPMKPEPAANGAPKVEEKSLGERPRERPPGAEKNEIEKMPPQNAAPAKRPEKKECGGPGQPECPK